jgi:hypothetical protein
LIYEEKKELAFHEVAALPLRLHVQFLNLRGVSDEVCAGPKTKGNNFNSTRRVATASCLGLLR